jgi:alpha-pyrone synthase
MQVYRHEALPLALKAVHTCIKGYSSRQASEITHIITVSCTGMYAPGLDIELIEALALPTSTQRYNINFMGCYAAFNGLKLADAICKSTPDALVLLVCVELCTIHYQKSKNYDQWVSNALFGDGAAAVLLDSKNPSNEKALSLENFYCDIAPEGKDEMAWHVGNTGFEMILSSYVPSLVRLGIKQLTNALLLNTGCSIQDVDYFAIHPGGKKILTAVEDALGIKKEDNRFAYEVLKQYGNMSSPTVLFVLSAIFEQLTNADHDKTILSVAFGPGLTMESMLLKAAHFNKYDEDIHLSLHDSIPHIA